MSRMTAIPEGYHSVQPYLIFRSSEAAIMFYTKAFGATEDLCMKGPDGRVHHASIQIGDSMIMMADESEPMEAYSAEYFNGSPVSLMVYTEDCDRMYRNALAAGAESLREPADQPYGDRMCGVKDPFGYKWHLGTHLRDVPKAELERM